MQYLKKNRTQDGCFVLLVLAMCFYSGIFLCARVSCCLSCCSMRGNDLAVAFALCSTCWLRRPYLLCESLCSSPCGWSNIFLSFGELDVNLHLQLSACLFLNLRHLILEFRSGLYEILNGHLGWKLLQRVMVLISCADKNATNQSNISLSFGEVDRDRCSQHL
jgi:hypothetical protein